MDHMVQEKTSSVVSGGRQYLISTAIVEIIGVVKCDTVSDVSRNKADWVKEWGWGGERGRCRGREKEEGGGGGEREIQASVLFLQVSLACMISSVRP